jgi:hypothetical protein
MKEKVTSKPRGRATGMEKAISFRHLMAIRLPDALQSHPAAPAVHSLINPRIGALNCRSVWTERKQWKIRALNIKGQQTWQLAAKNLVIR